MTKIVWIATLVAATAVVAPAWASQPGATDPVQQKVNQIIKRLKRRGFKIEAVVNHAAAAPSVGPVLPPTQVVFFGKNRQDASLLRRGQTVALDLPLRFLVYQDDRGAVQIETNDIGFLIDRHELRVFDGRLHRLNRLLDQFGDADNGIRTIKSKRSLEDTTIALRLELERWGFGIPLTIDYAERALRTRPTRIFLFGDPNVGTPLMQAERSIALDLPQKMLIYTDREGQTHLAYNDPFFLAQKHGLTGKRMQLGKISSALRSIAGAAAGIP